MEERMTVADAGRRGGAATKKRHGMEHYSAIGKKGGEAVKAKYGHDHYVAIGTKGGSALRKIVEAGRAAIEAGE